jgi:hypothetical protein
MEVVSEAGEHGIKNSSIICTPRQRSLNDIEEGAVYDTHQNRSSYFTGEDNWRKQARASRRFRSRWMGNKKKSLEKQDGRACIEFK